MAIQGRVRCTLTPLILRHGLQAPQRTRAFHNLHKCHEIAPDALCCSRSMCSQAGQSLTQILCLNTYVSVLQVSMLQTPLD